MALLAAPLVVASMGAAGAAAAGPAVVPGVPGGMLARYRAAAATCPGLSWALLAAIGTVESDNGRSNLPGVHSGANPAGAEGPMQFEPATFARFDEPVPPGGADPPSPYDPTDAVFAAARMLCADGAARPGGAAGAVEEYNHSAAYVRQVLALAGADAGAGGAPGSAPGARAVALAWALQQVGTPYVWGGEQVGVGFDCSGLVQAAYRAAGVALPRTAQEQWDAGPTLPAGSALQPGDLVFFGTSPEAVDHVGIVDGVVGGTAAMVDAPHSGVDVRVEAFPTTLGQGWGDEVLIGATRPA